MLSLTLLSLTLVSAATVRETLVPQPHPRFAAKVASIRSVGVRQPLGKRRPAHAKLPMWAHALHHAAANTTAAVSAGGAAFDAYVFSPIAFGADPSGASDASDAFEALLETAWAIGGTRTAASELTNGPNLGVVLDLQGGAYSLSRPLRFPAAGGGNIAFRSVFIGAVRSFSRV